MFIKIHKLYPKNKIAIVLGSVVSSAFVMFSVKLLIDIYPEYFSIKVITLTILLFIIMFIFIIINNNKINKILAVGFILIIFVSGVMVQSLNKGLNVFYDKPITKKVGKIIADDKTARWICVSTPYYITATGAYMVNSTNYFPNFKLWNILDNEGKYDSIYNKYAHLSISLYTDRTNVKLISNDHVGLELDVNQLKDIDVDYIISVYDLSKYKCDTKNNQNE